MIPEVLDRIIVFVVGWIFGSLSLILLSVLMSKVWEHMDKKTKREIEKWEDKTAMMVVFQPPEKRGERAYVHLDGLFLSGDLSDIARILRKLERSAR